MKPDSGEVILDGINKENRKRAFLSRMFLLIEGSKMCFPRFTVWENLKYISKLRGMEFKKKSDAALNYLEIFQLTEKKNSLIQTLSTGMQKKVSVIMSLISDAKLIIMDEPVSGLDLETREEFLSQFLNAIKQNKEKSFLITSHDLRFIERSCDKVILLSMGKIVAQDNVENLKGIFSSSTFLIIGFVNNIKDIEIVCNKFPGTKILESENPIKIEYNFIQKENRQDIYPFLNALKTIGFKINSVEKAVPDLEFIYKKLLFKRD